MPRVAYATLMPVVRRRTPEVEVYQDGELRLTVRVLPPVGCRIGRQPCLLAKQAGSRQAGRGGASGWPAFSRARFWSPS